MYGARVIYISPTNDFAIIENKEPVINPTEFNPNPVKLQSTCVVGNPVEGLFISANPVIIGINPDVDPNGDFDLYLHYIGYGTRPGFSGAGIFDGNNRLLGIVTYGRMWGVIGGGEPIHKILAELIEVGKLD